MVRVPGMRVFPLLLLLVQGGSAFAAGTEGMAASEVEALQRRLTDAKCYAGPIDGNTSPALDQAIAWCPSQAPQLRVETGMHVAPINRIGVDAACRLAATGSDDKTVRLWSLPEGRLLRTLRVPIGPGPEGRVYAAAVSPDGRWIAAGGWDARSASTGVNAVTVFEAATGEVTARIDGFGDVIFHIAFSPDGRWLATTTAAGAGVKVIDTSHWHLVAADAAYAGDSFGAAFAADGRLYTVAWDGKLRRYGPGPSFRKEGEIATRGGKKPISVAVDPHGKLLAVGFYDSTKVDIYDAATLASLRGFADTKEVNEGNLGSVAWSSDGERLVAGGTYGPGLILTFDRSGGRIGAPITVAQNTIMDLQPCGDRIAVAAFDPGFGLLDRDGGTTLWRHGFAPDMGDKLSDFFTVSADARQVRFGLSIGGADPVRFDLTAATLTEAPEAVAGFAAPRTKGLPVADWYNSTAPTFAGRPIALNQDELARSLAVRAGGDGFVLGSDFSLRAFDAEGKPRWNRAVPGTAWGVNLSADGRIITAAYADGTIRWHRWSDGAELLALFVNRDSKAWVGWTPSGYYMASPGGEDMIGWHLNRSWDQAADFFPASRFRDRFSRPDVVKLVLDTLDEGKALEQANAAGKRRADNTAAIIQKLPPVLSVVSPADGSTVAPGTVEIRFTVRSPSGAKVDRVEVFVDGAKVTTRGLARFDVTASPDANTTGTASVPMPAHDAAISLVAYTGDLAGDPVRVQLKGEAPPAAAQPAPDSAAADALKPSLYALLVGVSHYDNKALDLAYAADDATGLAAALMTQKGKLYRDVQVRVLTNKQATAVGFKEGLEWLQEQTTGRDLAIVFAAGHGITDPKGNFWFMTADGNERRLLSTAVSRDDITKILYDLPGKKLLFLDACHSGAAFKGGARGLARINMSTAVNDFAAAEGGVVAYAASTGSELSFEQPEWGHGAFTKALIEALGEGKADLLRNGTITTATLDAFVAERVKQLTGGRQHAVMTRPKTVPDFPVAVVR